MQGAPGLYESSEEVVLYENGGRSGALSLSLTVSQCGEVEAYSKRD